MILSRSGALPAGAGVAFGYNPARMKRREFGQLVEEALGELPACYRDLLSNIVIIVEDYPPGRAPAPGLANAQGLLWEVQAADEGLEVGEESVSAGLLKPFGCDKGTEYFGGLLAI